MTKKDKITFICITIALFAFFIILSMRLNASSFKVVAVFALISYVAYCVYILCKLVRKNKRMKKARLGRYGALSSGILKHISGLPIAKNVAVEVFYCQDKFVFKKDGQEFVIQRNKVTSVDVTTGQNVRSQQLRGASAGKYIFGGTAGAVIGSLAATSTYMIISYTSDDKAKFVVLDTASSGMFSLNVQKDFSKTQNITRSTVEL